LTTAADSRIVGLRGSKQQENIVAVGEKIGSIFMTIQYSLTRSENVRGFLRGVRTSTRLRTIVFVYSAAIAVIVSASGGPFPRPLNVQSLARVFAWAVGAFIFMLLWLFMRAKRALRTLTIAPSGISTQIGRLKGDVPWNKVKAVTDAGSYVLITRANSSSFLIPKRAFAGPDQQAQFLKDIEAWRRAAA
jgi:hypothetical protein